MRPSTAVAVVWSLTNVGLLLYTAPALTRSLLPLVSVLVAPSVIIVHGRWFAGLLGGGLLDRFASDRHQPTSPHVIAILGWLLLAIQSAFLVTRL